MKPFHISGEKGDIAENVVMSGDPLRTKYYAEKYLKNPRLVSEIRNMYVYTGLYKGKRVSLASAGMGIPSMGIYSYELYKFFGVKQIIRVGTCGVLSPEIKVRDILVADSAYSISSFNQSFGHTDDTLFFPNKRLTNKLYNTADKSRVKKCTIYTSDVFDVYVDIDPIIKKIPKHIHVAASEMEAAGLFLVANRLGKKAACLLTVTDSKFEPGNIISKEERQNTLDDMMLLALDVSVSD